MIGVGLRGTEHFVTSLTEMLLGTVICLVAFQLIFLVKLLTASITAKLGARDNLISFIDIKSVGGSFSFYRFRVFLKFLVFH